MDQVMDTEGQPGQTKEEINFYWHLFRKSLKPGYILFEADYFPLTHTGIRFLKGRTATSGISAPVGSASSPPGSSFRSFVVS
jgi:hypothetical protein